MLKRITVQLTGMIATASPVDKGVFASSWDVGIERYPQTRGTDTGGNATQARGISEQRATTLQVDEIPKFIGISNPMEYGPVLEYGRVTGGSSRSGGVTMTVRHSKKSEPGFVRAQVEAMRSRLRAGRA